jgi:hypothetical protein
VANWCECAGMWCDVGCQKLLGNVKKKRRAHTRRWGSSNSRCAKGKRSVVQAIASMIHVTSLHSQR